MTSFHLNKIGRDGKGRPIVEIKEIGKKLRTKNNDNKILAMNLLIEIVLVSKKKEDIHREV